MAKDTYLYFFAKDPDDPVTPTEHENNALGIQLEFEARMLEGSLLAGFLTGGAPSLSALGTLSIPAPYTAYASGKRFTAAASYVFTTAVTNAAYTVFLDASAEALAITTGVVDSGIDLPVAQVTWADPTLSALEDIRIFGLLPQVISGFISGNLSANTVDAVDMVVVPNGPHFFIEDVEVAVRTPGGSATTAVDVHAGPAGSAPTTVFTTQTRRPTVPEAGTAYAIYASGVPEVNRLLEPGSIIEVFVDTAGITAANLAWTVRGRALPTIA